MKKITIMSLGLVASLFLILCLLRLGFYVAYSIKPELGYRYQEKETAEVKNLSFLGDKKQYVLVMLGNRNDLGISMSQNYLVTVTYKNRVDPRSNKEKIDEGESLQVTTYDLNNPNITKKEFDLVPLLLEKGFNHQVFNTYAITYKGQDYLLLQYYVRNSENGIAWYNLESGEIIEPLGDYLSIYESLGGDYWGFGLDTDSYFNILVKDLVLNRTYDRAKNLETTNLSLEEPEIAKNLTNGGAVYIRPNLVDRETRFNTIIHWFAPQGQDVMELYATDKATGEKTQIKSYADFEAWKAAHPDDDDKQED